MDDGDTVTFRQCKELFLTKADFEKQHGELKESLANTVGDIKVSIAKLASSQAWNRGLMLVVFASLLSLVGELFFLLRKLVLP